MNSKLVISFFFLLLLSILNFDAKAESGTRESSVTLQSMDGL